MKITKLGHSCVLIHTEDRTALFDPGVWANRNLIDVVEHVDRIVYTHEHPDHFDVEILRSLVARFPEAHIICHKRIETLIKEVGIDITVRQESNCCVPFVSPHEELPVPGAIAPEETGYHFKGIFTHPGDSQRFAETMEILAMPFIGPWGKTGDSIKKVLELQPKYVLPIHDWHYTEEAKKWLQGLLQSVFEERGIILLENENGKVIELPL